MTQTKKGGNSAKPKAASPKSTTTKPAAKVTPKRPAAAPTPAKSINEKAEWEKAIVVEDARERIVRLKAFLDKYPKTTRRNDAIEIILKLRWDLGNERLVAGDVPAAIDYFKVAVAEAPSPVSDNIFSEILEKIAPNLYLRGAGAEAVQIQRSIEKLVGSSVSQLLAIANFYLSVENGAEVLRLADELDKLKPDSAPVAQVRALGLRMQFQLDESEAAFAKAVELDPEFIAAKRGLAEAKRAAGKFDEATAIYREILAKEPANVGAKTGLVLAMFDLGKQAEAEVEMNAILKDSASNVILLAGAAYWYAANGQPEKAVDLGKRAVDADPRFIWSHIAYARGLAMQDKLAEAEKALLIARKYGNFPTLDLELALVRMDAGFYREAAETLDQSFVVAGDKVSADLGLRVRRSAADLIELTSHERRSSIFAFRSGLDLAMTEKLRALLEYSVMIEAETPDVEKIVTVASRFIGERDKMRPFRELYVASHLASKGMAPERVLELTKDVIPSVDAAAGEKWATSAILADEIYYPRTRSISNNEYVELPIVPKQTLTSILRGRIEEINGIALAKQGKVDEAVTRFRRSKGVLPENSSWWRSATWRLGAELDASGKSAEALEQYYLSYRAGGPDPIKYAVIEATYRKANGNTEGLVQKIGENPLRQVAAEPTPTPVVVPDTTPTATPTPQPILAPVPEATPIVDSTPKLVDTPAKIVESKPLPTPGSTPVDDASTLPTPTPQQSSLFPPVVITIPKSTSADPLPAETTIKPCTFTLSENVLNLAPDGKELGLIVGTESDEDITGVEVKVSSDDVTYRREPIAAIRSRALFVVKSATGKVGTYSISFELPCGKKEVEIRVR